MRTKILFSVSGGKTSGMMAKLFIDEYKLTCVAVYGDKGKPKYYKYVNDEYEVIFVFSNTSREDNRTLKFLKDMFTYWGLRIVWLESVVHHGQRKGSTYKIVNYGSANRQGDVFEEVIKKYGIPNKMFPHCTRELKLNPITSFKNDVGFKDSITAIGYRYDEPKRVNLITAAKKKHWYLLYERRIVKPDVETFWSKQPFNLMLLEFEGNCKLCYKKSKRKLLTQIVTDSDVCTWVKEMQKKYSKDDVIRFFRGNETMEDLIKESTEPFKMWVPPTQTKIEFDYELDEQEDCSESCEPF